MITLTCVCNRLYAYLLRWMLLAMVLSTGGHSWALHQQRRKQMSKMSSFQSCNRDSLESRLPKVGIKLRIQYTSRNNDVMHKTSVKSQKRGVVLESLGLRTFDSSFR